jgi:hypothetical protein
LVESLRRQFGRTPDIEKPQVQQLRSFGGLEASVASYCQSLGISEAAWRALRRPTRHLARPDRDLLIDLLWRHGGFRLVEIGQYFGIGYPAVSIAKARTEALLQNDKALQRRLKIIM